jgi:hypothetical protein
VGFAHFSGSFIIKKKLSVSAVAVALLKTQQKKLTVGARKEKTSTKIAVFLANLNIIMRQIDRKRRKIYTTN